MVHASLASIFFLCLSGAAAAQRPSLQVGTGLQGQSVAGATAAGTVVEVALAFPVASVAALRVEGTWAYAPRQGQVYVTGRGSSSRPPSGLPHLWFGGGSLVVAPRGNTTMGLSAFGGASVARGSGTTQWSSARAAFVPHLGVGWRPMAARPALVLEARVRYAPVWLNEPLRLASVTAGWTW